jgi:outer membrane protein assembly factor BamB
VKISAKLLLALAASASLGGCAVLDGVRGDAGKKNNTPTVGNRVDILGTERDMEVDPALANVAVILPPAVVNEAWAQPGGNASKSPGHVELGQGLSRIWSANVTGANPRARLAASPVVSDSRVYVVDTTARVTALDANSGAQIWSNALEIDDDGKPSRFGGARPAPWFLPPTALVMLRRLPQTRVHSVGKSARQDRCGEPRRCRMAMSM